MKHVIVITIIGLLAMARGQDRPRAAQGDAASITTRTAAPITTALTYSEAAALKALTERQKRLDEAQAEIAKEAQFLQAEVMERLGASELRLKDGKWEYFKK